MEFKVNFKVVTKNMVSYEFKTSKPVFVEDADCNCFTFRLFIEPDGSNYIMSGNSDDYAVHEDVSHLFDGEFTLMLLDYIISHDDIQNQTNEYIEWLKDWLEECDEYFHIHEHLWKYSELSQKSQDNACLGLIDDQPILEDEFPNGLDLEQANEVLMMEDEKHFYYSDGEVYGGMY